MNPLERWTAGYQHELEHAKEARAVGNEGMARVCARRAAGILIGEYLQRRGYALQTPRISDRVATFSNLPDVNPKFKVIASHFLLKVDHEHKLPDDIDLINEVQFLEMELLEGRHH